MLSQTRSGLVAQAETRAAGVSRCQPGHAGTRQAPELEIMGL